MTHTDGNVIPFARNWTTGVLEMLADGNILYQASRDTLGQWDSAAWACYLPDALGSIRQATDAAGSVTSAREWTPFGVEVGTFETLAIHAGEEPDPTTGALTPPIHTSAAFKLPGFGPRLFDALMMESH